jgi:DNA-binding NtrC family response regulator
MESELFGHVGGAYTGARGDRPGAFAAARGGTLFLDEIGDAPLSVQLGLLRALESRRIKPVGSDREVDVDVRVIAATSRNLDDLVAADRFRVDLYHRIAQLAVRVPPLRDRPADVEWLAEALLHAAAPARTFTDRARTALLAHEWPGNVRELRNTIERAVALGGPEGALDAADLMLYSGSPTAPPPPVAGDAAIVFPKGVVALARRALDEGSMPKPDGMAPKKARSWQRAAFLYLRTEWAGDGAWPPELMRQFQRLFGQLWATTERGRGLLELMMALGLYPSDDGDRARR